MKKTAPVFILIILLALAGCNPVLESPAGSTVNNGTGTQNAIPVPGGDWRTTDDITFLPEFKLYSMIDLDPETATTNGTFGLWEDNKYHVEGYVLGSSKLDSTGWADVCFLYYDHLFEGPFTISVRVRLTAVQALSSSKGAFICALAPDNADDVRNGMEPLISPSTSAIGSLIRSSYTGGATTSGIIPYRRTDTNSWDARTSDYLKQGVDSHWKTEYIFVLGRDEVNYYFELRDSKTEALVSSYTVDHEATTASAVNTVAQSGSPGSPGTSKLHPDIKPGGKPLLLGVALLGSSAEISNIRIWDTANPGSEDTPLFETGEAQAAYVAVDSLTVTTVPSAAPGADNVFTFTQAAVTAAGGKITLTPHFIPASTDNPWVRWLLLPDSDSGFLITGSAPTTLTGDGIIGIKDKPYTGDTRGEITVPAGGGTAHFLGYSFDPRQEDLVGSDYPLKQTLAEFNFTVKVN